MQTITIRGARYTLSPRLASDALELADTIEGMPEEEKAKISKRVLFYAAIVSASLKATRHSLAYPAGAWHPVVKALLLPFLFVRWLLLGWPYRKYESEHGGIQRLIHNLSALEIVRAGSFIDTELEGGKKKDVTTEKESQ